MNKISKLTLSDEEQQLVNNRNWILTKRIIIDKVSGFFGNLSERQKIIIENETSLLPAEIMQSVAKISKGENYLQLPYVILDYPRCFDVNNTFAVRTMFWWGNFFSVTLLLSGIYKEKYQEKLSIGNTLFLQDDLFICVHESCWHHHFNEDNYKAIKQLDLKELEEIIRQKQFIKLAVKFPLQQWEDMHLLLERSFDEMIEFLKH